MRRIALISLFIASWIFVTFVQFHNVLSGSIPFWYDPARDMLMGWDNLHKLTLIGPTSGIPGIFYGPHWIWLLSFGELFSKDPRIVILIVETIPYLILFPLGLYLFVRAKIFDMLTAILLWIVFVYSFGGYIDSIWSPNPAPLMYLFTIYFLITQSFKEITKKVVFRTLVAGLIAGLALNFHISFTTGFIIGSFLYLLITPFVQLKKIGKQVFITTSTHIISFITGIVIMFSPFLIFEIRHGFMQTKVALNALAKGGAVVGLHGLTKPEILWSYFARMSPLLQSPVDLTVKLVITALIVIGVLIFLKKIVLTNFDRQVLLLLCCITIGVLGIYLSAKNPVWAYHFIGSEVIALMLLGFILSKLKPVRFVILIWVFYLTVAQVQGLVASYKIDPLTQSSLYTKEQEVKIIQKDAGNTVYAVYAYSPSIYTYEYSYLFRWLAKKDFSYDPAQIQKEKVTYLILPAGDKAKLDDFINYRTPVKVYTTIRKWHIPDGTTILKRVAQ